MRVDTAIRAVEVSNGNSEDATVSESERQSMLVLLIWNALRDPVLS